MDLTDAQIGMALAGFFGIGLILYGLYSMILVNRSRGWSSTEGRIVSSRIEYAPNSKTDFEAAIEYEYIVDGKLYYNSRTRLSGNTETARYEAEARTEKYPRGKSVTVYYAPENPQNATLERNLRNLNPYVWFLMGMIFTILAIHLYLSQPVA
jgi:Ca2+/Na+ antiporter